MSVKAAILGTQHPDVTETEQKILLAAATEGLQRIAGYIPLHMPIDKPSLFPMAENFVGLSDLLVRHFCGEAISGCNSRVPYIGLAWLLIGTNNYLHLKKYVEDDTKLRQVAGILIRIAVGDVPNRQHYNKAIIKYVLSTWGKSLPKTPLESQIYDLARSIVLAILTTELRDTSFQSALWVDNIVKSSVLISRDTKLTVIKCIEYWQNLPDENLLQIMATLTRDILPPE